MRSAINQASTRSRAGCHQICNTPSVSSTRALPGAMVAKASVAKFALQELPALHGLSGPRHKAGTMTALGGSHRIHSSK